MRAPAFPGSSRPFRKHKNVRAGHDRFSKNACICKGISNEGCDRFLKLRVRASENGQSRHFPAFPGIADEVHFQKNERPGISRHFPASQIESVFQRKDTPAFPGISNRISLTEACCLAAQVKKVQPGHLEINRPKKNGWRFYICFNNS